MVKTLPFDCLLLVLDAVEDLQTLHALLCVNRAFLHVVATKLYRDPFVYLSQATDKRRALHAFERLVLSTSPADDERTQRYRDMHYIQRADGRQQPLPTMDYLGLIRCFDWGAVLQDYRDYINNYRTMCIFASYFGMNAHLTETGLQHVLTWAACAHQPKRIESVYICAREIAPYMVTIGQWVNLHSIILDATTCWTNNPQDRTLINLTCGLEFLKALAICRGERSLRSLKVHHLGLPNHLSASCKALRMEMMRHMTPLNKPKDISLDNWDRFSAWAGEVDCSEVRSLCWSPSMHWDAIERWWPDLTFPKLLQRCRRLTRIKADVEDERFFRWAVEEKNMWSLRRSGNDGDNAPSIAPPFPVEYLKLEIVNRVWNAVVIDAFEAFGDTLEQVELEETERGPTFTQPLCVGSLHCPRLKHLLIKTAHNLLLAPDALELCPLLESLELTDIIDQYVHARLNRRNVWRLPHLVSLKLTGTAAVEFHPASLYECRRLQKLSLRSGFPHGARAFYPQMTYEVRSDMSTAWSWDWHLPRLTELDLVGDFATWFDIKFLTHCPQLKILRLELLQGRRVTMMLPHAWRWTSTHSSSSSSSSSCGGDHVTTATGRHIAHALQSVSLKGRWILSDDMLDIFLLDVLPNLKQLELIDCVSYTPLCLVECIRRHPTFTSLTCSRQLTRAGWKMMGLTTLPPEVSNAAKDRGGQAAPILTFKDQAFTFQKEELSADVSNQ